MNRKNLILISGLLMFSFGAIAKKKSKRPNILFIMSDDHTSQAIGAYHSRLAPLNPTPTIDRIAEEGIRFENAFCTNSICTPSRACIITGQYSQTNGALDLGSKLPVERQYLPLEMKKLGYQTAIIGKWHLHTKPEAFDYYNVLPGQGRYFDPVLQEKGSNDRVTREEYGKKGYKNEYIEGRIYKGHSSDVITDISLDWLENQRDKSKPFLLLHHFKAPHDLFEFNPKYKDYLEDTFIPEPSSLYYCPDHGSVATRGVNDQLRDTIGTSVGRRNIMRNMGRHMRTDKSLSDLEYKHQAYQEYLKRYLRCVKGVDDNVKRLFDYLEKNDLMDNTIIIYTGDQGFNLGEHDYIDKRWIYEESMRMPFMVRYPKTIKPKTVTDAIINNTDFAPTIIDMAGGKVPSKMQGHSFKSILETGEEPNGWQQETYYRYWMHMAHHCNPAHFGIRTKRYKLILFYGKDYKKRKTGKKGLSAMPKYQTPVAWEFYDLQKDPGEMVNRYDDPKYASVIKDLKVRLKNKRKALNEEDNNYPDLKKIIEDNWNL
ncbi:sulfatase [Halosquirtibacter xylanolyticus]|uniref:sulfatase family protein n=1 Tax=Halosquirtibacter xylanolyticus TaxID=3374599 RepID=UPI003747E841|nr:sulfatase [Prolixibacteraceae bacterium]